MEIFSALILISGFSCKRCPCPVDELSIGFIGYDSAELQTVILKKYEAANGFQNLISIDVLDSLYPVEFQADTAYKSYCRIGYGNNWEIELPSSSFIYSISDLLTDNTKEPYCGGVMAGERFCNKQVVSIKLNGQTTAINSTSWHPIYYIHK